MREASRRRVRLGIAGAGATSQLMHLPILSERDDVEVVAVSDLDAMKVQAVARRFGIAHIVDDDDLIADEAIDGVVVAAPSFLHERLAAQCLAAGKHVLVERPLALSRGGVNALVGAAREAGKGLVVGMAHRYQPDVSALREAVAQGRLGKVSAVSIRWLNQAVRRPRSGWRRRALESGGGALMDLGVPALDMALWVLGCPRIVRVSALAHGDGFDVEEEAHVMATTDTGASISLAASWRFHGSADSHGCQVLGVAGSASLPPLSVFSEAERRAVDITPRMPRPSGDEDLYTSGYRRLLDHFVRVASGEREGDPPHEQATLMGLVEAAYESARLGREVLVGDGE